MSEPKQKIVAKLIRVYEAIDCVKKLGENTYHHYSYVRAADVVHAVRAAFIKEKLYAEINMEFVGPAYTIARAQEINAPFTAVNVRCFIVVHDQETGETVTGSGLGTGADSSDKAVYKAQTGALKYALRHAALIPDEAGTDPEADESVDKPATPQGSTRIPASDMPDFHDAQHETPKPRIIANDGRPRPSAALPVPFSVPPLATQPAATAQAITTAAPEREPGDEPGDATTSAALPTEEELTVFRKQFSDLGDELTTAGKLKSSKGLPVNRKLVVFLLSITKAENAKVLTTAQWYDFFKRADAAKALDNGLIGLAKLVNKANGIEETKK